MVDLPRIPRRLVTTEAPRSSVGADDYAALGNARDRALSSVGGAMRELGEEMEVDFAKKEAEKVVTRDENGNPVVMNRPMLFTARAKEAYEQIVESRATHDGVTAAKEFFTKARLQHDGNPEKFREAAVNYTDQLVGNLPPRLGNRMRRELTRMGVETYDGMLIQRHNLDVTKANEATDADIMSSARDMQTIALQGGTDTDGYKAAESKFHEKLNEKVNNPLLAYPKEKADLLRESVRTKVYGAVFRNELEKKYDTGGHEPARQFIEEAAKRLGGTVKETDQIVAEGRKWLRAQENQLSGDRRAFIRQWGEFSKTPANLAGASPAVWDEYEQEAKRVGAHGALSDIIGKRAGYQAVTALSPEQQREAVRTGRLPPGVVDRIIGVESGGNPDAKNPNSSATGSGQFIESTWLRMIEIHRPELAAGRTKQQLLDLRRDPQISREITTRYAEQNAAALDRAGLPVTLGSVYLMHFLGPGDAPKVLSAPAHAPASSVVAPASLAANRSILQGKTVGEVIAWADRKMEGGPRTAPRGTNGSTPPPPVPVGRQIESTASREEMTALRVVERHLKDSLPERMEAFETKAKAFAVVPMQEIESYRSDVGMFGTPEQKRKADEVSAKALLNSADPRDGTPFKQLPPSRQEEIQRGLAAAFNQSGEAVYEHLRKHVADGIKILDDGFDKDKYGTWARVGGRPVAALDLTSPQAFASGLPERVAVQSAIQEARGIAPFSIFSEGERDAFRRAVTQGDANLAGGLVGSLVTLPKEQFMATLADPQVKSALDGMVRSYDPARMTPAFAVMNRAFEDNPIEFTQTFKESVTRLQTWRSMKASHTALEIAAHFQQFADEPSKAKAREGLMDVAKTEAKKITVDNVIDSLYNLDHPLLSWVPFTGYTPPKDGLLAARMKTEWDGLYQEFRGKGLDEGESAKQATTRLATVWGNSSVTGQVMRFPPDRDGRYPRMDESFNWMTEALHADVEAIIGIPRIGAIAAETAAAVGMPTEGQFGTGPNWSVRLMSDSRTEAEIGAKQPPSYIVAVTNHVTGQTNLLMTDKFLGSDVLTPEDQPISPNVATPLRYRFSLDAAKAKAEREFLARDEAARARLPTDDIPPRRRPMPRPGGPPFGVQ